MFKKLKEKFKFLAKRLWKDESAQGATEYILLLVAIVGILSVFGPEIRRVVEAKIQSVGETISNFGNG